MTLTASMSAVPAWPHWLARETRGKFQGWMEKVRRLWERRFDRLEDYLRKLQQKEGPNGRKN